MTDASTSDRVEFDLALHSEVHIARPAERVWPYLDRLQAWKDSVVSVEQVAGVQGAVGEVIRIGQRPGAFTVYVIHKTLAQRAPRWKLQSMVTEDGVTTDGYVTYTLIERDAGTLVVCTVAGKVRVPLKDAEQAGGVEQLARVANEATLAKLDTDHAKLKHLLERS